jgi:hypothetical protein
MLEGLESGHETPCKDLSCNPDLWAHTVQHQITWDLVLSGPVLTTSRSVVSNLEEYNASIQELLADIEHVLADVYIL